MDNYRTDIKRISKINIKKQLLQNVYEFLGAYMHTVLQFDSWQKSYIIHRISDDITGIQQMAIRPM